jgi:hypothetical protein
MNGNIGRSGAKNPLCSYKWTAHVFAAHIMLYTGPSSPYEYRDLLRFKTNWSRLMKRSQIADLQSSLQRARDQLEDCRTARAMFEQQMDVNSCDDHRALIRLYNDETKSECEVKFMEQKILDVRPFRNLLVVVILIICSIIVTAFVAYFFHH